jgi:hypothetical protein
MLRIEPKMHYYVYPSWAELPCPWGNLSQHLSNPLQSPFIKDDPNWCRYNWRELGYPKTIQPFDLIDGPVGGGIVRVHAAPFEKWLPGVILGTGANVRSSDGMNPISDTFESGVFYLEPSNEPGWELGLGKKAKVFLCDATTEHAESAGDQVYWIVPFKSSKQEPAYLDQIPRWARDFDVKVSRADPVSDALREETALWFVDPSNRLAWFEVRGGPQSVGYQFAVSFYVGLHGSFVSNRRGAIHLVAQIENKPNARIRWTKK